MLPVACNKNNIKNIDTTTHFSNLSIITNENKDAADPISNAIANTIANDFLLDVISKKSIKCIVLIVATVKYKVKNEDITTFCNNLSFIIVIYV